MDSRARELVKIGGSLFSKKQQLDQLNQEIAEQLYPMRADFTSPFTLGEDFSEDLMESFPSQARETLGNMIGAMLRQGGWFAIKTGREELDEDPVNARWLESSTADFRTLIYDRRANFTRATVGADHDYVAFGNPVLSVGENSTRQHLMFNNWHPRDCAWMENADGKVDHLQRSMPTTARNIMARQAWAKNAHSDIRKAAKEDPTKEFKVRHIVLPTDEIYGDDKAKRRKYANMPFMSLYVDCENEEILGEGPLPAFNYVVPRWRTVSGWPYGFSPAAIAALPDSRMIQQMARILLEQGEKALDPPWAGKGEIFRDGINLYAGGFTYVDLEADEDIRQMMMPMYDGANINIGLEMKQDVRNLIAEAFLLNKLMLPSAREMTAVETNARLEEFRRAALPFFGPIESDYHLPLLDAAFQIALRNDAFNIEEMPDALEREEVTFTFESPLNSAEGRQHVIAYQESIQILAGAAQFDKTIPTTIDFKQMTKDAVKGTGAPADWFADEEKQLEDEEAQNQADNLLKVAQFAQTGAAVGGEVANASMAMQQAGLA